MLFLKSKFDSLHTWLRLAISIIFAAGAVGLSVPASAKITIDTSAARETLKALLQPKLTKAQALVVADLPGNQAMIRKLNSLDPTAKASRDSFADTLVEVAHGLPPSKSYGFKTALGNSATMLALLDKIERDPKEFQGWVTERILRFSQKGLSINASGYIIVGGWSDGFSFDDPTFYLNLSSFEGDFIGTRLVMAHELYHAVQNIARAKSAKTISFGFDSDRYIAMPKGLLRDCYATQSFFGSLMSEGTATYVGDPDLLPLEGKYPILQRQRTQAIYEDMSGMSTLLEISLAAITGAEPTSPDDVYAFNFYGRGGTKPGPPMYDLGYVMAKAIVQRDGDASLGALISKPPEAFVKRYIAISNDPASKLTKLGPRAVKWAERAQCPVQ